MNSFKVLRMHEKSCELVLILVKAEENAKSDVVDTAVHSSVHSLCVVCIVMLWSCRVKLFIALLVICLLEEDICSDACLLEFAVVFNGSCGNVDIYTTDSAVLVLDRVNSVDTFKDILDRIVYRVLT